MVLTNGAFVVSVLEGRVDRWIIKTKAHFDLK